LTVEAATRLYVETFMEEAPVLRILYSTALNDERFAAIMYSIRQRIYERVTDALEQADERGYCRDLDIAPAARAVVAMAESFCIRQIFPEKGMEFGLERTVSTLAAMTYSAVLRDRPRRPGAVPAATER
jgi:predicted subunit of tRNA(5-methylaminomethyl-2-thiouridylate) methyltransferase